jgi:hypothetical protein
MYAPHFYKSFSLRDEIKRALVGRSIVLSVFLMIVGGTGFALPDWIDVYDFYGTPSSGSLGPTTEADVHAGMFSPMPNGGFGPPTASFQMQNVGLPVVQPHPALGFKNRWLFDYAGSHHLHRQHHHRRRWVVSFHWSAANVRQQA